MLNKTALTIGLSVLIATDATPNDIEAAHDAIDNFFSKVNGGNGVVTSATLMQEGGAVQTIQTEGGTIQQAAPAGAVELDKDGVNWDERIHSGATNDDGSHKKTDKGLWQKRRGVDDGLYKSLTAQLKQANANNTAAAAVQATNAPMPGATVALPGVTLPGTAPALPTLGALAPLIDPNFAALSELIGRNIQSPANPTGRITDVWVKDSLKALGVPDGELQTLAAQPALIVSVLNQFRALGLQ